MSEGTEEHKMRLQMNHYDYFMARPTNLDPNHGISLPLHKYARVPVIRLYGSLNTGQRALCHVHGVLPYIYILYEGGETDDSGLINQRCARTHQMLETALEMAKNTNNRKRAHTASSKDREPKVPYNEVILEHIANVSVIKALPFYGYHSNWSLFYKITLLDPADSKRLADLICDHSILPWTQNTYESHIPYLLQFSIDYNLYGCGNVDIRRCYFRKPILNELLDMDQIWTTPELEKLVNRYSNGGKNILSISSFPRTGNSLIEFDVLPQYIENRDELKVTKAQSIIQSTISTIDSTDSVSSAVTSAKQMVDQTLLQRQLLSLETYEPPVEVQRLDIDYEWQSVNEWKKFLNDALRKASCNYAPTKSKADYMSSIKSPFEAISELWVPEVVTVQESETSNEIKIVPNEAETDSSITGNEQKKNKIEKDATGLIDEGAIIYYPEYPNESHNEDVMTPQKLVPKEFDDYKSSITSISFDSISTQDIANGVKSKTDGAQLSITNNKSPTWVSGIELGFNCYRHNRKLTVNYNNILDQIEEMGYPRIDYLEPFYSDANDMSSKPFTYAGKRFLVSCTSFKYRQPLNFRTEIIRINSKSILKQIFSSWKYSKKPPAYEQVRRDLTDSKGSKKNESQIQHPLSNDTHAFKMQSETSIESNRIVENDVLSHFSLEILTLNRKGKLPDPKMDPISMIFWHIEQSASIIDLGNVKEGILAVTHPSNQYFEQNLQLAAKEIPVSVYQTEFDMIEAIADLILVLDPDALSGYEIHNSSWGYLLERSLYVHNFDLYNEISRVSMYTSNKKDDKWGYQKAAKFSITGRHMINIWRIMRTDLTLTGFTFENVVYHLFHQRLPRYSQDTLTALYNDPECFTNLVTLVSYWMTRVRYNMLMIDKVEFISRTMEQARFIGIDFNSVIQRGSQYKVESFLIRICKSENFVAISPSRRQVQQQKPLECIPLVMEPNAAFYKSPLVVLDFQSLYPSIMIAYNYCFSTIVGRVRDLCKSKSSIGVTETEVDNELLAKFKEDLFIAPNGVVYVKETIRKSVLARMLADILNIRVLVKSTMAKLGPKYAKLKRMLNNKQLALKLLANVTYGYASASFSGRMPCSDLADSIVQTGRETLEKAINIIEHNGKWGAKVVYGDTDSLFVYLPGRTKEEAFHIGKSLARMVTERNPKPVILKFEKVYFNSILLTKKRYVGFAYEYEEQTKATFDAKGIETVRRDGHPAQQKIVEKALRILFETKDLSMVKRFVKGEFGKIQQGRVSIQDFCFAKEVKLGSYKNETTAPPGAHVAKRKMEEDTRSEPQFRERVPYLIVKGKLGQILRERALSPEEFLANKKLELDSDYYINKTLVPPLERLFNIIGVDVASWASEVTRSNKINPFVRAEFNKIGKLAFCRNCKINSATKDNLCDTCNLNKSSTVINLRHDVFKRESQLKNVETVCKTCAYYYTKDASEIGLAISLDCDSRDCPIYYTRLKVRRYLQSDDYTEQRDILERLDSW